MMDADSDGINNHSPANTPTIPAGTRLFGGKVEIVECLGAGASGVVYKARTFDSRCPVVAMKLFPANIADDKVAAIRLSREMRTAFRVHHHNVMRYYENLRNEQFVAITLEYIEGENLETKLDRWYETKEKRDFLVILDWTQQIAAGLQAIHDTGIIHRDIKPANIIITNQGNCKISDFGLAIVLDAVDKTMEEEGNPCMWEGSNDRESLRVTRMGSVVGTPTYISPEYVLDGAVTVQGDIYSLGVVMYEMITGRCPFEGETVMEVLENKVLKKPVPPHKINSDCPVELSSIVLKAIARDPSERYLTVADVVGDLRAFYLSSDFSASIYKKDTEDGELPPEDGAHSKVISFMIYMAIAFLFLLAVMMALRVLMPALPSTL